MGNSSKGKRKTVEDLIEEIVPVVPHRIHSGEGFQLVDPITLEPIDHVDIKNIVRLRK